MTDEVATPDPGNSEPDVWSADFAEDDPVQLSMFEDINTVAVSLPEPPIEGVTQ